jgi:S1-C subfamily serine protease
MCSGTANSQDLSRVRESIEASTVFIEVTQQRRNGTERRTTTATGFIVTEEGHIITAAHVLPNESNDLIVEIKAAVQSRHAHKFPVTEIFRDVQRDFALLLSPRIGKFRKVKFGRSADLQSGSKLVALGFPRGMDLSLVDGVLSSRTAPGGRWQTTLPIHEGNSGGPVCDTDGYVVAMATGGLSNISGITFVTPEDYFRNFLPRSVSLVEPPPATDDLRIVRDGVTGVQFGLPRSLSGEWQREKFGRNWTNSENSLNIDTLKFDADWTLERIQRVIAGRSGRVITNLSLSMSTLDMEGYDRGGSGAKEFFRVIVSKRGDEKRGLSIVHDANERQLLSSTVSAIARSLVPFP